MMITCSVRYCIRRPWNGVLTSNNCGQFLNEICRQKRKFSKKGGSGCCKDVEQTKGRQIEEWPKPDQASPLNSDPYRIKVHDVAVPPLPTREVKDLPNEDSRALFGNPEIGARGMRDLFHNSAIVHPDYWKEKPDDKEELVPLGGEMPTRLSYHGRSKYKFAFHEPWKPLDRLSLLAQAEQDEKECSAEQAAADRISKT